MPTSDPSAPIRIGVDLGGTKIEALAIDAAGHELVRRRIPSPAHDYSQIVEAVRGLVGDLEQGLGRRAQVGIGTPGAVSRVDGLMKNANSTVLNGRPFARDIAAALAREVRVENDANCFALSEATDGAGRGHRVVFGVILGTGVGGCIVVDGRVWGGANAIAGEWGHNEMPARGEATLPDTPCYCGRRRCIETFLSGPGLAADHARHTGSRTRADATRAGPNGAALDAQAVAALAASGDPQAQATMARYTDRLARALATVVNVLDPDIVVLGGGLSNIDALYAQVATRLPQHVFSDRFTTPVVRNQHGDSSGVRGAAWLWPPA
ncbi:MAG: ROK family protein [Caldimonas sp.]